LSVLTPPDSAPPTVKWTARSSSFSSGSGMVETAHDAVRRQGCRLGGFEAADLGRRRTARIEPAARWIGLDRRHDARDLAQRGQQRLREIAGALHWVQAYLRHEAHD